MRSERRRAARALLLGLVGLVAACDAPTMAVDAPAYDPSPIPGEGFHYRWSSGKTIAVFVDPTAAPEGYDLAAATRTAAGRWSGVTRVGDYAFAITANPAAADVVIRFRNAPPIVDLRDCEPPGGGAGRTVFCIDANPAPVLPLLDGGGGRVKVEVYVDPLVVTDDQLALAGMTRQEYFVALVTHELGHVLGIGNHSDDATDIMNAFPRVRVPSADDERTLRWVWRQAPDLLL